MRITVRRMALVAVAGALGACAPAQADPIVALGTGDGPASAVTDQNGSLHAVWRAGKAALATCTVPAGGTACTPGTIGGFPGLLDDPHLLQRADGTLIVIVSGGDANSADVTFSVTSGDGGATWSAPAVVGRGQFEVEQAILTPDGQSADTLSPVPQLMWQRVPVAGPVETRSVALEPEPDGTGTTYRSRPDVLFTPDGRPMVAASSASSRVGFRVLKAGADPYANASWTPWSAAPRLSGIDAVTAFGPNGVWALVQRGVAAGQGQELFRFAGARFVRPKSLGTIGGPPQSNDLGRKSIGSTNDFTEDAGGRLHAVWDTYGTCGAQRHCFFYRRNEPRGFGPVVTYPLPLDQSPDNLRLAPNAGGSGWMVWTSGLGAGRPLFATPLATPPRGSRVGSRRVARGPRVTLPTRYGCVPPGGRYLARLLVAGRARGVRITSVRFSFDGGGAPSATDRRAPYRHSFRLPFAAGERHVAEARVTYRKGARTGHTQVGRAIVMCP
jgi:hypothetical protein